MFSNFGCIAAKLVVLNLLLFVDYKREKAKCFDEKIHFLQSFFLLNYLNVCGTLLKGDTLTNRKMFVFRFKVVVLYRNK